MLDDQPAWFQYDQHKPAIYKRLIKTILVNAFYYWHVNCELLVRQPFSWPHDIATRRKLCGDAFQAILGVLFGLLGAAVTLPMLANAKVGVEEA